MEDINPPVQGRVRVWFNEDLESRNFIVPGIIAIIIMIVGAMLTSLVIAREYENGTMETITLPPHTGRGIFNRKIHSLFFYRHDRCDDGGCHGPGSFRGHGEIQFLVADPGRVSLSLCGLKLRAVDFHHYQIPTGGQSGGYSHYLSALIDAVGLCLSHCEHAQNPSDCDGGGSGKIFH